MVSFTYTIKDPEGLHARPAGLLVKRVQQLSSETTVSLRGTNANAKRLFAVMGLAAKQGDTITITLEGDSEQNDAREIKTFLEETI